MATGVTVSAAPVMAMAGAHSVSLCDSPCTASGSVTAGSVVNSASPVVGWSGLMVLVAALTGGSVSADVVNLSL